MIVLLSLLAGLGVASANAADAPILTGGGGASDPPRSWPKSRLSPQQHTQHPPVFTLTSGNRSAVKLGNAKSGNPVIEDEQSRQHGIRLNQPV